MAVVDASVWVSLFKENDQFHRQAKNIIQSLILNRERIYVPAIVFTEVAGVIKRTTNENDAARNAVHSMKKMSPEVVVDFGQMESIATEIAINHSQRGADACYLAVAKMTRSDLYTFDKQQAEAFEAIYQTW